MRCGIFKSLDIYILAIRITQGSFATLRKQTLSAYTMTTISFSYFWNEVIRTKDEHKQYYIGSACLYNAPFIALEFLVLLFATSTIINFTQNVSYYCPLIANIIIIIYAIIFIIVSLDIINITIYSIGPLKTGIRTC